MGKMWMLRHLTVVASTMLVVVAAAPAQTSTKPWQLLLDSASSSSCDVINADNAQLVLLTATSQLSIVTQTDVTLQDTQVDADGFVTFEGQPAGAIGFATDGDGLRTVWWMSLTGTVVNVNGFTGEPTQTNKSPSDFFDVACDACQFWDDPTVCAPAPPPEPTPPPVTVNLCGTSVQLPIGLTAGGLVALSFARRRR
jgi:hypothetical protein